MARLERRSYPDARRLQGAGAKRPRNLDGTRSTDSPYGRLTMNAQPLITPLILLLKSRKVVVSLCALALTLLITIVPDRAPFRAELMTVVTGLALALIGGIAYEDAAKAGRDAAAQPPQTNAELIKLLFG